jgi:hypothetical protein
VVLSGAAGIELCPLDAQVVADYLRASAGGPAARARWDGLLGVLADPTHPVGQALTTPLMATLARTIYSPRAGEPAADLPDPARLLGPGFESRAAVERHLFDGFVPAAYRPHPDPARRCPWTAADAQRWLAFLAGHLEQRLGGTPDLAWWELRTAVPRPLTGLAAGAPAGLLYGLVTGLLYGLVDGVVTGLVNGLVTGLLAGLPFGLVAGIGVGPSQPAQGLRWSRSWRGFVAALLIGIVLFPFGLPLGLAVWLATGLKRHPVEPAEAPDPRTVLRQDRGAFRNFMLTVVLAFGIAFGLVLTLMDVLLNGPSVEGFVFRFVVDLIYGPVVGLAYGLPVGLAFGLSRTAWGRFAVARCWLAARGRLPWRLMRFLADAHQHRGVLRQAGASYQFRHAELQRRLAGQP